MLYIICICLCHVYRSELKLRSVRTAIYGASLLCVALVKSCVGQKKPRGVPVTGAGRGGFSGLGWDEVEGRVDRVSRGSEGSLTANGRRKWLHLRRR